MASGGVLFGGAVPEWDAIAGRVAFDSFVEALDRVREDEIFAPMATLTCVPDGVEIIDDDGTVSEHVGPVAMLAAALDALARLLPLDVRSAYGVHEVLRLETWNPLLTVLNLVGGERLDLAEGWRAKERADWIWSEVVSKIEGRVRATRLAAGAAGSWEASLGRRLVRSAHGGLNHDGGQTTAQKETFLIEPGAVRLVELAEAAGALPLFSCEGHPGAESIEPSVQLLFRPDRRGLFADLMKRGGFRIKVERRGSFERVNALSPAFADFDARDAFLCRACARIEEGMTRAVPGKVPGEACEASK